jgi:hypothetical protein
MGGAVARMEISDAHKIWLGSWKERNHSKDLGVDRRIVLNYILEKQIARV